MAKTCPSCGYNPIGPFTDNCPICAEPVRQVRSDSPWMSNIPHGWRTFVAGGLAVVLAIAVCIVGFCGLGLWQMNNVVMPDMKELMRQMEERKARTVVVSANELLKEFQANPTDADKTYQGKYLELTGIVDRTGKDGTQTHFVVLRGEDKNAEVKIECFFEYFWDGEDWDEDNPAHNFEIDPRIEKLKPGDSVTVQGEFFGRVSHIQIRQCRLPKVPAPSPAPSPAPATAP